MDSNSPGIQNDLEKKIKIGRNQTPSRALFTVSVENLEHLSHTIPGGNKTQTRTQQGTVRNETPAVGEVDQPTRNEGNLDKYKNEVTACVCAWVCNYSKTVISWSILFSLPPFLFNPGLPIFFNQLPNVHDSTVRYYSHLRDGRKSSISKPVFHRTELNLFWTVAQMKTDLGDSTLQSFSV